MISCRGISGHLEMLDRFISPIAQHYEPRFFVLGEREAARDCLPITPAGAFERSFGARPVMAAIPTPMALAGIP